MLTDDIRAHVHGESSRCALSTYQRIARSTYRRISRDRGAFLVAL